MMDIQTTKNKLIKSITIFFTISLSLIMPLVAEDNLVVEISPTVMVEAVSRTTEIQSDPNSITGVVGTEAGTMPLLKT